MSVHKTALVARLAWRNVWRNLRRTLITLSAVSFGLASVIVFFGFTDGFHAQWIDNMVRTYSGHIQLHAQGYHDDPQITNAIKDPSGIAERLSMLPEVDILAVRVELEGLASTAENSAGVLIRGIDPEAEDRMTLIRERVVEGHYLEGNEKGVLIGKRLAKKLGAGLGDKIVLMAQAADGTLSAGLFRVAGIFRMGSLDFDSSVAIISIEAAREFSSLGDEATEIAVLLKNPEDAEITANALKKELGPTGLEVLVWQEVMPALTEMLELDDVFMYVILVIVLVVVAFGILNTMLMSIMERTRELGIMMALGTRPRLVAMLVVTEAMLIGALGTLMGAALGVGANGLIALKGFDLSRWAGAMEFFAAINPVVYPQTDMASVLWASAMIFSTAIASSVYPAFKAARLRPVEAIHFA